ncbi:MAG: nuclease-related domain-containing protein [Thiomicrorhabdus sp.]|nr:nuclease-related domain-containing protein [Thiomicrorhabdus sp.]
MAIVVGQIEPLKQLKKTFAQKGIYRFGSIGDIKRFQTSYQDEKAEIPILERTSLEFEIERVKNKLEKLVIRSQKSNLSKLMCFFSIQALTKKHAYMTLNFEKILAKNIEKSIQSLDAVQKAVNDAAPIIAGAIGENQTVKVLSTLPDDFFLINDFSVRLAKPIYNRKDNERIYSIQIDHLLVSKAGVFLIETKNWSKQSVERLDLRSPVSQVRRSSFALFVLLNSDNGVDVNKHHWGSAKIPIKNIVVMTRNKPNEQFKHIKILAVHELLGYIQYFDDVFSNEEVKQIFEHLCRLSGEKPVGRVRLYS